MGAALELHRTRFAHVASQRKGNRIAHSAEGREHRLRLIEKMPGAQALRNTTRISKMTSTKPSPPLG